MKDVNETSYSDKETPLQPAAGPKPWQPPPRKPRPERPFDPLTGTGPHGPLSKTEQAALPGWGPGPAICLVQPQMGENIGAAARAMANFGLDELILVQPRDVWPNPKAWAMASGATWPLDDARLCSSVDEAVADKTLVLATTGTPRQLDKPLISPRAAVAAITKALAHGEKPIILFGSERSGLDNDHIISADLLVTFPVDGRFPSLNLAQSVACLGYEWACQTGADVTPPGWQIEETTPAPRAAFESYFNHMIAELDITRFFWPEDRKTTMVETLRNALLRARFTMGEISLLRGALKSLVEGPRRRARESDSAAARAQFEAWLASEVGGLAGAQVVSWQHLDGLALAVVQAGEARMACMVNCGLGEAFKVDVLGGSGSLTPY